MADQKLAELFAGLDKIASRPVGTPYTGTDLTVSNVGDNLKADYTVGDAWSQLGGNREQQTFDMRMLALSDPGGYAKLRTAALGDVKTVTEGAFNSADKQFVESGFSREEAKHMALQSLCYQECPGNGDEQEVWWQRCYLYGDSQEAVCPHPHTGTP